MPDMHDIAGTQGLIVCAGPEGRLLVCRDGRTWGRLPSPAGSAGLNGVWVHDSGVAWVVGERGTVLRGQLREGAALELLALSPPCRLLSVWGCAPDEVWIGGPGFALHWVAGRITEHAVDDVIVAIGGGGPDDVWLGGARGRCFWWEGRRLREVGLVAEGAGGRGGAGSGRVFAVDVAGGMEGRVVVAGAGGLLLRSGERGWERVPVGIAEDIRGVRQHRGAAGPDELWLVTDAGRLCRWREGSGLVVELDLRPWCGPRRGEDGACLRRLCVVEEVVWMCGRKGIFRYRQVAGRGA